VTSLSVDSVGLSGVLGEISVDVLDNIQTNWSAKDGGGSGGSGSFTFDVVNGNSGP